MRLVIDTNIFIGAILGSDEGSCREVLTLCLRKEHEAVMSAALYAEYLAVSSRSDLMQERKISPQTQELLLNAFFSVCHWQSIYFVWRPNLRDESDNHLIDLAVAAQADAIISKNVRDLRNTQLKFPQIQILKPEEFLGLQP
jgi:putative PIN family toxin of toxin-antitoxin system